MATTERRQAFDGELHDLRRDDLCRLLRLELANTAGAFIDQLLARFYDGEGDELDISKSDGTLDLARARDAVWKYFEANRHRPHRRLF